MTTKTSTNSLAFDMPQQDGAPLVPDLVQLLPASGFTGRDGRGPYTYTAETLIAAFAAFGMPLPLDYEHQSLNAADKAGETPAAGWITELVPQDDGTLWGRVEWTEKAAGYIEAREYRFLSPVFQYDVTTGEIVQLIGAGLTNNPNLYLTAFNSRSDSYTQGINTENQQEAHVMTLLEQLNAALGLAADATEAEALAAVQALDVLVEAGLAANAKLTTIAETVGAESKEADAIVSAAQSRYATDLSGYTATADHEAALATAANKLAETETALAAMTTRATDAETALAAHKAEAQAAKIESDLSAASAAGVITPAQVEAFRKLAHADYAAFSEAIAKGSPVMGQAANTSTLAAADTDTPLTAEQKKLCRAYKLSEAAFKQVLSTLTTNK